VKHNANKEKRKNRKKQQLYIYTTVNAKHEDPLPTTQAAINTNRDTHNYSTEPNTRT